MKNERVGIWGALGTKCSNPKPTSQRVTWGFYIFSVLGQGQLSYCDPAEWQKRLTAFNTEYQLLIFLDLNCLYIDVKKKEVNP